MNTKSLDNTDSTDIPDKELYQNYQNMNETGKEELLKETEKILEIHKIEGKKLK